MTGAHLSDPTFRPILIVLDGKPVTELPEEDRRFLFLAEPLFPGNYNLFFRHGEYLGKEKKDFNEAIPRLKKALEIQPKSREVFDVLAFCHEQLKQTADELRCWESLREIVELSTDSADLGYQEKVFKSLGKLANENGKDIVRRNRFIVYVPHKSEYDFVLDELSDSRLEEIYAQVTGDLDCIPDSRTSILVLTPDEFADVKPTSWAGAFAEGKKSMTLPVTLFSKTKPDKPLPCRRVIVHEYTHNIVHISAGGKCPKWLNEGMAEYEESKNDSFIEYIPISSRKSMNFDPLLTPEELEKKFQDIKSQEGGPEVQKAYFQAKLFARFLVEKFTLAGVRQILNGIKGNMTTEAVLKEVTQLSLPAFQAQFKKWLRELDK